MERAFAFSADEFRHARVDEMFSDQADELKARGFPVWTCRPELNKLVTRGEGSSDHEVVYRGWMLGPEAFAAFVASVDEAGGTPFHTLEQYLAGHHLPNWYPAIQDLTAETVVLAKDADLRASLEDLGWDGFFLKDYVKSLKTSQGSVIRDPSQAPQVAAEMEKFRGHIEGGFCVRRLVDYVPDSEVRYFVLDGVAHGPDGGRVPDIVLDCAERITGSRFFSVDVARTSAGQLHVVELGDGQVSDLVGWEVSRFADLWGRPSA